MPVIYLITSIKDFISVKKQVQDGVEFVVLETGSDFTCLDLEDEETAGKVEYALIDLPVLAKHWKRMTALKWVHTFFNGADVLLKTVHKEALPTFTLTRTLGHVNAPLISDYVIGHIIAAERKFFLFKEFQNEAKWNSEFSLRRWRPLNTRTIGILGVGLIGSHVAETCKKLGMTVWGLTRTLPSPETSCSSIDVYKTQKDLSVFLSACDYLCAVLPSTPGTRNLLSGNVLQACQEKDDVQEEIVVPTVTPRNNVYKAQDQKEQLKEVSHASKRKTPAVIMPKHYKRVKLDIIFEYFPDGKSHGSSEKESHHTPKTDGLVEIKGPVQHLGTLVSCQKRPYTPENDSWVEVEPSSKPLGLPVSYKEIFKDFCVIARFSLLKGGDHCVGDFKKPENFQIVGVPFKTMTWESKRSPLVRRHMHLKRQLYPLMVLVEIVHESVHALIKPSGLGYMKYPKLLSGGGEKKRGKQKKSFMTEHPDCNMLLLPICNKNATLFMWTKFVFHYKSHGICFFGFISHDLRTSHNFDNPNNKLYEVSM